MSKKILISSSIKFHDLIKSTIQQLEILGHTPLFPNLEYDSENKNKVLTPEDIKQLASEHYDAMKDADAVYFILPEGYMGTSCKVELGYALALGKTIYFSEPTKSIDLDCYPKKFIHLDNLSDFKEEFK